MTKRTVSHLRPGAIVCPLARHQIGLFKEISVAQPSTAAVTSFLSGQASRETITNSYCNGQLDFILLCSVLLCVYSTLMELVSVVW